MRDLVPVIAVVTCYVSLLFLLAVYVERRTAQGRNLAANAWVYALSQAVYATTWTYYGSVGYAVNSGLLFLTIYLGPTLTMAFAGSVLRKLVRIKERQRITSIADFISTRYGKSQAVGTLVAILVVFGLVPYLALQLESMIRTVAIISHAGSYPQIGRVVGPVMVVLMVIFTISFGIRRLRPTERHPGMIAALVAECVVKLVAFLVAGIFVTYFLYHGFGDLLSRATALPSNRALAGRGITPTPLSWFCHLLLAASAIFCLPRQFHVAVVENSSEDHIRTAQWLLPLYFLAISIFVIPVASAGIAFGLPPEASDTFVLALPVAAGPRWLAWLVFLGGFSAGTGMVMIETMTMATMVSNHLLLPIVQGIEGLGFLRRYIRPFRWVAAAAIISAAFAYERLIGWRYGIVLTGLTSFAAVLQFAPAILIGLYWKQASRTGALLGMGGGFLVWAYVALLPFLAHGGLLPTSVLERGPFGLAMLRPEALFGIGDLDPISRATVWPLASNIALLVLGSLLWPATVTEAAEAERLIHALGPAAAHYSASGRPAFIDGEAKRRQVERLFAAYFGEDMSRTMAGTLFNSVRVRRDGKMSILQLAQLEAEVEGTLASTIGAAAAHVTVGRAGLIDRNEAHELSRAYAEILADLRVTPADLRRKIDYHREHARLLAKEARMVRALADGSRRLAASLEYEATARTAASIFVPSVVPASMLFVADSEAPLPRIFVADIDAERGRATQQKLLESGLSLEALPPLERALRTGRPVLVAPDGPAHWPPLFGELRFNASLTLPLLARGNKLGTLTLLPTATSPFSHPHDLGLVEELANRCAVALDNASLFHRTQEAVRARDEFMAVASHELRTPLTPLTLVVQGLHRLLGRGQLGELSQAQLDASFENATKQLRRLSRLVDNLLDVTRLRRGELRLTLEETDLEELVVDVVRCYREALMAAQCSVTLDLQPGVVGRWDAVRLQQMVTNLLINAIRYAPGHPIGIRSFAHDGMATVVVRDHGPGISKEDQARIFRPFERGVSYRDVSGFGLGLYVVREVVEAHGGHITLESELGAGCAFIVELPLEARIQSELPATEPLRPA